MFDKRITDYVHSGRKRFGRITRIYDILESLYLSHGELLNKESVDSRKITHIVTVSENIKVLFEKTDEDLKALLKIKNGFYSTTLQATEEGNSFHSLEIGTTVISLEPSGLLFKKDSTDNYFLCDLVNHRELVPVVTVSDKKADQKFLKRHLGFGISYNYKDTNILRKCPVQVQKKYRQLVDFFTEGVYRYYSEDSESSRYHAFPTQSVEKREPVPFDSSKIYKYMRQGCNIDEAADTPCNKKLLIALTDYCHIEVVEGLYARLLIGNNRVWDLDFPVENIRLKFIYENTDKVINVLELQENYDRYIDKEREHRRMRRYEEITEATSFLLGEEQRTDIKKAVEQNDKKYPGTVQHTTEDDVEVNFFKNPDLFRDVSYEDITEKFCNAMNSVRYIETNKHIRNFLDIFSNMFQRNMLEPFYSFEEQLEFAKKYLEKGDFSLLRSQEMKNISSLQSSCRVEIAKIF